MSEKRPYVLLKEEFKKRQAQNPRYSLRAFAQTIGIASGRLSEILSNKRSLTLPMGRKIAERLHFTQEERDYFLSCIESHFEDIERAKQALKEENKPLTFQSIPDKKFSLMSDWYHLAILSAFELNDFQSSIQWLSNRLGIPRDDLEEAIVELEGLDLLDRSNECSWELKIENLKTTDDTESKVIREYHKKSLTRIIERLESSEVEDRDLSAMTMAIDKSKLPIAKKMIREFRRDLCKVLESGSKEEVYSLNIQLTPMSFDSNKSGEEHE